MKVSKAVSVLVVSDIAKELETWKSAGFQVVAEVPHGETTGFAIVSSGSAEVMLQTPASLAEDLPAVAERLTGRKSYCYLVTNDVRESVRGLKQAKIIVPERETSYGMREIFIQTAGGEIVGFAQEIGS